VTATDPSGNVRTNTYRVSASGAGATYAYDPNGNLTQKTEGTDTWTYSWNAENLLTRVEKNAAEVARFSYDPIGRRVEKVAGGVTTSYVYDGEDILREVRGATVLKYVHGLGVDAPLARDDGAGLASLHADGLGSIVKMTNATGAVTLTRQYDAWGNPEVGTGEQGHAFTGREWDPETGLYYYRARYYDARSGRFIREDPVGLTGGLNRYRYVNDNPITLVDPFGSVPSCPGNCLWLGGGATGAVVLGAGVSYELGICKGECGWSIRQRLCTCTGFGLGGTLGKLGGTFASTAAQQEGWCVATPDVTVSGPGWIPNAAGIGPGLGLFYMWCDCSVEVVKAF
jgi:RHS repeat-associated protein